MKRIFFLLISLVFSSCFGMQNLDEKNEEKKLENLVYALKNGEKVAKEEIRSGISLAIKCGRLDMLDAIVNGRYYEMAYTDQKIFLLEAVVWGSFDIVEYLLLQRIDWSQAVTNVAKKSENNAIVNLLDYYLNKMRPVLVEDASVDSYTKNDIIWVLTWAIVGDKASLVEKILNSDTVKSKLMGIDRYSWLEAAVKYNAVKTLHVLLSNIKLSPEELGTLQKLAKDLGRKEVGRALYSWLYGYIMLQKEAKKSGAKFIKILPKEVIKHIESFGLEIPIKKSKKWEIVPSYKK